MKLKTLLLASLLLNSAMAEDNNTTATAPLTTKQEGIKYIKMLGGSLKSELVAHMKADKSGVSAFGFCSSKATEITAAVNTKLPAYAKVRRTALKLRNSKENGADALDTKIMNAYVAAIEAKSFTPEDIKVVEEGNVTRVYKPLLAKPVCLKCHGSSVSKEITDMVNASYPQDNAMHFKEGSFRGVMVSEIAKH